MPFQGLDLLRWGLCPVLPAAGHTCCPSLGLLPLLHRPGSCESIPGAWLSRGIFTAVAASSPESRPRCQRPPTEPLPLTAPSGPPDVMSQPRPPKTQLCSFMSSRVLPTPPPPKSAAKLITVLLSRLPTFTQDSRALSSLIPVSRSWALGGCTVDGRLGRRLFHAPEFEIHRSDLLSSDSSCAEQSKLALQGPTRHSSRSHVPGEHREGAAHDMGPGRPARRLACLGAPVTCTWLQSN